MARGRWREVWAEAKARGPEAVAELQAVVRFYGAQGELRERQEDQRTLARLTRCAFCRAPIPSLKRRVCPPCRGKGLGRG